MKSLTRGIRKARGLTWWAADLLRFSTASRGLSGWERMKWRPQVLDRDQEAGAMQGAYFHQDLHVAQRIFLAKPRRHVDVGSRIDGFVAHVASFRPIELIDIRPATGNVPNISVRQADLSDTEGVPAAICDSLSCLHALEHFGLGRYGDPIDPRGHERGFASLVRMLEPGGTLYLSVPIGRQEVLFNCHRRFRASTIVELAGSQLVLQRLDLIDDRGNMNFNLPLGRIAEDPELGCRREGCGIFEFTKVGTSNRARLT